MHKMCSDERKCAVMKGCDELRRNKRHSLHMYVFTGMKSRKLGVKMVVNKFSLKMCSDELSLKYVLLHTLTTGIRSPPSYSQCLRIHIPVLNFSASSSFLLTLFALCYY